MKKLTFILLYIILLCTISASEQNNTAFVRIKAVTSAKTPVQGVKITLSKRNWDGDNKEFSGKTSASGDLSIGIPAGRYMTLNVSVEPPAGIKYAPHAFMPGFDYSIRLSAGEKKSLTLLFVPADASISGKVTDSKGKPVKGAVVRLSKKGWLRYKAETDAKGKYRLARIAPGSYKVTNVNSPKGSSLIPLHCWKGVKHISLKEKEKKEVHFSLPQGASITGRILGPEGKPVKGASVSCSIDAATEVGRKSMYQRPGESFSAKAVTDAQGRYMLGGLTTETYVISVRPPAELNHTSARVRGINIPVISEITWNAANKSELYEFATAPIYFALGIALSLLVFPEPIRYVAITVITLGDGGAHIFGIKFGKTKLPFNKGKNWEGSAFGFIFAFLASMLFVEPVFALIAATVGMIVESIPSPINDNCTIPLTTGLVLLLLM